MLFELFVIGGLWFWLLSAATIIGIILFIDWDRGGSATGLVALSLAVLYFFGDFNPFPYLKAHPWQAVEWVGGYFLGGVVWACTKWWFYVRAQARNYAERLTAWRKANPAVSIKTGYNGLNVEDNTPQVSQNKSRIMTWMSYWPFSFVWTMINDPVRRAFEAIYRQLGGFMQKIADKAFAPFHVEVDRLEAEAKKLEAEAVAAGKQVIGGIRRSL